jgi:hypothetical protein
MKTFACLLLVLATLGSTTAYASTWTVTTSGTIGRGFDAAGVFGSPLRDLTGLRFTQSVTASTDPMQWQYFDQYAHQQELHYVGPGFVTTVTVDGYTIRVAATTTTSGTQYITDYVGVTNVGDPDLIYSDQNGVTASGIALRSGMYVRNYNIDFVPSLDYAQHLKIATGTGYDTYSAFNLNERQTWFTAGSVNGGLGAVDLLEVNPVDVPEPSTALLTLLSFAILSLQRRAPRHLRRVMRSTDIS